MHTAAATRRELLALLAGGLPETGLPGEARPAAGVAAAELRRSAVLILFGALDRIPAENASGPAEKVSPALDVLLIRRADGLRHHAGQIAFPGGGAEPQDQDLTATALREASEETGLDPAGVEALGSLPSIHIPVSGNLVTPVIGWWRSPSEVMADRNESVDVFRVPVAELLDPARRVTAVYRRGAIRHRGPAFVLGDRFGGHLVWGFTGMLLSAMFDRLDWALPWNRAVERSVFD